MRLTFYFGLKVNGNDGIENLETLQKFSLKHTLKICANVVLLRSDCELGVRVFGEVAAIDLVAELEWDAFSLISDTPS
jgi:hypothetical protein